jgi:hypothetical protein
MSFWGSFSTFGLLIEPLNFSGVRKDSESCTLEGEIDGNFENDQIIDRGDIEKLIRTLVGDQNQDIDKEIEVFFSQG